MFSSVANKHQRDKIGNDRIGSKNTNQTTSSFLNITRLFIRVEICLRNIREWGHSMLLFAQSGNVAATGLEHGASLHVGARYTSSIHRGAEVPIGHLPNSRPDINRFLVSAGWNILHIARTFSPSQMLDLWHVAVCET